MDIVVVVREQHRHSVRKGEVEVEVEWMRRTRASNNKYSERAQPLPPRADSGSRISAQQTAASTVSPNAVFPVHASTFPHDGQKMM